MAEVDIEILLPYLRYKTGQKLDFDPPLPSFSLEDLVGKTIVGITRLENPVYDDSERPSPPSDNVDVISFSDKSYLLNMYVRFSDVPTEEHSFLVEGNRIRYSECLFNPDVP